MSRTNLGFSHTMIHDARLQPISGHAFCALAPGPGLYSQVLLPKNGFGQGCALPYSKAG